MADPARGPRPRRRHKSVVSSSVVAAATAGVTGITLAWAVGSTPTPDTSAGAAAKVSSQIAADKAAMDQLRKSIADTRGQLSALGGVNIPAGPAGAPGTAGTTAVTGAPAAAGSPASTTGTAASGSVAYSGSTGATGSSGAAAASGGSSGGAPAAGGSSGGGGAPAPAPTSPAPTSPPPTAPPATSPPTTTPAPPVTTKTRASGA